MDRPSPSAIPTNAGARIRVERQGTAHLGLGAHQQVFQRRFIMPVEHQHVSALTASAALSSKDGFSVVAPTIVIVPSSM